MAAGTRVEHFDVASDAPRAAHGGPVGRRTALPRNRRRVTLCEPETKM